MIDNKLFIELQLKGKDYREKQSNGVGEIRYPETMKYIDIYRHAYLLIKQPKTSSYFKELDIKVLVWSANHEHAIFEMEDEVHPATVCVWFQCYRGKRYTIHKIQRIDADQWKEAEVSVGSIPFVNHNPFDPRKQNAASNTAESVFPQNSETIQLNKKGDKPMKSDLEQLKSLKFQFTIEGEDRSQDILIGERFYNDPKFRSGIIKATRKLMVTMIDYNLFAQKHVYMEILFEDERIHVIDVDTSNRIKLFMFTVFGLKARRIMRKIVRIIDASYT